MINPGELLFVVDENNNPIESKTRKDTHADEAWHRISYVWIINSKGMILCQKRSRLKDADPGKWEAHFGGHVAYGDEYIEAALKETREELGLERKKEELNLFKIVKYFRDKEFQAIYYTKWDGEINELTLEKEEVEEIKWVSIPEIEAKYKQKDLNWVHEGFEDELLSVMKNT